MDFHSFSLRVFITLAKTRSFSQTADILGRTQSAITQQIDKIESILQKKLCLRAHRTFHLTHAGEVFLNYAQRVIQESDFLLEKLQLENIHGTVTLGAPEDFTSFYLPRVLRSFKHAFPSISLEITCEVTELLLQKFAAQTLDLIIFKRQDTPYIAQESILWTEELCWVGEKSQLSQGTEPLPLITSPAPCLFRKQSLDLLQKARVPYRIVYTSPSLHGNIQAMRAGLGVSLIPTRIVPKDLQRISSLPTPHPFMIGMMKKEKAPQAVDCLYEYISAHFLQKLEESA